MQQNNRSRAVFISTANIFNSKGNGGEKASKEHYDMLTHALGEDNVAVILFVHKNDVIPTLPQNVKVIIHKRIENKILLLLSAFFGCRVYLPWNERKILKEISSFFPDLVFMDYSVAGRLFRKKHNYKTVCFFHNVESDYTKNKMKTDGMLYFPAYIAAKRNDKWALNADSVMCFNERDSRRLFELYRKKADYIFPISFIDRFDEKRCNYPVDKRILFLGSCFGPNRDGIEWFIKEVMPYLQEITLDIVGLGFEEYKDNYEQYSNVSVIGSVDCTDEYYYSHPVVIMPIRYGAGMKVKTAEAMMFGRFIVASDEAPEGYDVSGTEGIMRCNTASDYIATLNSYFNHPPKAFEQTVRNLFLVNYNSKEVTEIFANVLIQHLLVSDQF